MKTMLTVFAGLFAAVILAAGDSDAPKCPLPGDWLFDGETSDEFDGLAFDLSKWWPFAPWWRGRREYVYRTANVVQRNGFLELWAKRIPESEQEHEERMQGFWPYTCAIIKSRKKVEYGYFEARAKGTAAEVRNAFWLYDPLSNGIERPWTKYARNSHSEEIDIYEFVGRFQDEEAKKPYRICSHVHRFETPYVEGVVNSHKTKLENEGGQWPVAWCPSDGYHVYGLLWTEKEIVWYVDGVATYRRDNDHFHMALHVMLDTEIATWRGAEAEKLDPKTLPAAHSVDYFRRWTFNAPQVRNCEGGTPLVEAGKCNWTIVCGSGERDKLAADDYREIFEKATGVRLGIREIGSGIGDDGLGKRFLIGNEFTGERAKGLKTEETLVFEKDGDIVFAGGGVAGSCYAVYDFCEKYFGYRLYGKQPGAEIVCHVRDIAWDGKEISTRPTFTGYRLQYGNPARWGSNWRTFTRRNRLNGGDRPLTTRVMNSQHGHLLWVPPYDADHSFLTGKWKGLFQEHPEYFSMGRNGARTDKGQPCFANHELRKIYIARFRKVVAKKGPGIYTVASNDSHNERYCWCDGCAKLMEKYRTNGGPLWDFVLELCEAVKDMKDVYVTSLAYKGPEQTELAPTDVVFPENFVCDAAFLNGDRPPSRIPDLPLEGGRYNRIASLKQWHAISKHLAWWYYGGSASIQTYRRMQIEFKEIHAAGVDSIGSDGTGGEMEFGDVGDYMFCQLARNPDMDADAAVMDIFRHKYGAAAEIVFAYLKELEAVVLAGWDNPNFGFSCMDGYERIPLDGADMIRWQGYFKKALAAVADDSASQRQVEIARSGLDAWTIVYASRIRAANPKFPLDVEDVLKRGYAACVAAEADGLVAAVRNPARRVFNSMKYYARLKTDALPPKLAAYDARDVRLYLPEEPLAAFHTTKSLTPDSLAAAGVAMASPLNANRDRTQPVVVQLHDSVTKEWLKVNPIPASSFAADRYTLVNCGTARLPRRALFVLGDCWGTALDMRNLGRYYDPTYHEKRYEFWVSVRLDGDTLFCDRVYLVDKGMPN